MSCLTAN